eukprot:Pgem_evm1s7167
MEVWWATSRDYDAQKDAKIGVGRGGGKNRENFRKRIKFEVMGSHRGSLNVTVYRKDGA